jgi:hypothetical protein
MNVKGLVYLTAFYFCSLVFGWKAAIGCLAFMVITNLALTT